MLNGVKVKSIYATIQRQLFYMIPEKWEKIYLYAAVLEKMNHLETGEMFFYYYPKGLLKKNPVNVYEIPSKFNIEEETYMQLVNKLYDTIQLLRKEFEKAEEKVWSNLTISIADSKFHVEYDYENLEKSPYSSYDRHIIWQYKYLNLPIEKLTKKDRKMLETYLLEEKFKEKETKKHMENMYQKNVHNMVEYNRVESFYEQENEQIEENLDTYEQYKRKKEEEEKKLDTYEQYKRKKQEKKNLDVYEQYKREKEEEKNLDAYERYKRKKEKEKQIEKQQNREFISKMEGKQEKRNQILNFKS